MIARQKVVVPCNPIWGGKHIQIQACPAMCVACLPAAPHYNVAKTLLNITATVAADAWISQEVKVCQSRNPSFLGHSIKNPNDRPNRVWQTIYILENQATCKKLNCNFKARTPQIHWISYCNYCKTKVWVWVFFLQRHTQSFWLLGLWILSVWLWIWGFRSKFWTNFHREGVIGSMRFLHQGQNLFPQLQDLPVNHGFSPLDQTKT